MANGKKKSNTDPLSSEQKKKSGGAFVSTPGPGTRRSSAMTGVCPFRRQFQQNHYATENAITTMAEDDMTARNR